MNKKFDLYDLSTEIVGISAAISGLSNQLDNNETDSLQPDFLRMALYALSAHLDRIVIDLEDIDSRLSERGIGV